MSAWTYHDSHRSARHAGLCKGIQSLVVIPVCTHHDSHTHCLLRGPNLTGSQHASIQARHKTSWGATEAWLSEKVEDWEIPTGRVAGRFFTSQGG